MNVTYELFPLNRIGSGVNLRSEIESEESLTELASSMSANGLLQPVGLALNGKKKDKAEIVWGFRRVAAARQLGWTEIDARVFPAGELSEAAIRRLRLLENVERKNLTPMEEAEGARIALHGGMTADDLAEALGVTSDWVRRRARTAERLSPKLKTRVNAGEFSIETAEIVARIATHAEQEALFEEATRYADPTDVHLRRFFVDKLRDLARRLAKAPFDTEACEACPHRSDRQTELFSALKELDDKARCTSPDCWDRKAAEAAGAQRDELAQAGYEVAVIDAPLKHEADDKYCYQDYRTRQELKKAKAPEGNLLQVSKYPKAAREKLLAEARALGAPLVIEQRTGEQFVALKNTEQRCKLHARLAGKKNTKAADPDEGSGSDSAAETPSSVAAESLTPENDRFYQNLLRTRQTELENLRLETYVVHPVQGRAALLLAALEALTHRALSPAHERAWLIKLGVENPPHDDDQGEDAPAGDDPDYVEDLPDEDEEDDGLSYYHAQRARKKAIWHALGRTSDERLTDLIGLAARTRLNQHRHLAALDLQEEIFALVVPDKDERQRLEAEATAATDKRLAKREENLKKALRKVEKGQQES